MLSTTSATILGSNPKRVVAFLQNCDGTIDVTAQFGEDAVMGEGYLLKAGGGFLLINDRQPWTGDVRAIAASGTPVLSVTETSIP